MNWVWDRGHRTSQERNVAHRSSSRRAAYASRWRCWETATALRSVLPQRPQPQTHHQTPDEVVCFQTVMVTKNGKILSRIGQLNSTWDPGWTLTHRDAALLELVTVMNASFSGLTKTPLLRKILTMRKLCWENLVYLCNPSICLKLFTTNKL